MITWKRIGLENLTFPKVLEYKKEYIPNIDELPKEVTLYKVKGQLPEGLMDFDNNEYTGLGQDFIDHIVEFNNSGLALKIPKKTKIDNPIIIRFEMNEENPIVVDHNIIIAEEASVVTVIFDYSSSLDVDAFHNGLTKVFAKENSVVNIIKIQRLNDISKSFDSNVAFIDGTGKVNWVSIELGSSVTGANYSTFLNGDASQANLSSIYLGDGHRKIDVGYSMIHKGVRSLSNIETKGVLMDESRKVFRGNLYFKKGARASKGVEGEYVLLLDPTVKSDSIPGLFCEEDDVQGEHAASAGQMDKDKLFYLMSRGLSERESKKLIVEASFRPVIDKIPLISMRDMLMEEIDRRLLDA